jgi:glycosyltransferase involved in cell wall biosynthesis
VIFSGVTHHRVNGEMIAHGGFVREVDVWAKLFKRVMVAAIYSEAPPPADAVPYTQPNVTFAPLDDSSRRTVGLKGKLYLMSRLSRRLLNGARLLEPHSVVMARGPDGVGFSGVLLTRFSRRRRFAKYAGQWAAYQGEAKGYRIQKAFYRSKWFGGPVLVYGVADPKYPHLIPINIPSSISLEDWKNASQIAAARQFVTPVRLLFVGRLTSNKDISSLIEAIALLRKQGIEVYLDIVGDGGYRNALEQQAGDLGIADAVVFHGWMSRDAVLKCYETAFCLINCSWHMGIDKTLPEAMTYALPIIAPDLSITRAVLHPPDCGILYQLGSADSLANAITQLTSSPQEALHKGQMGRENVRGMTLEVLEVRYREFLQQQLNLSLE